MGRENAKPPPSPAGRTADAAPGAAPDNAERPGERSGRVVFDDRGNAVWEWAITSGSFGSEPSTERLEKLENPSLAIDDDAPTPVGIAKANPLGAVKGYDPYESGTLQGEPNSRTPKPRKKDLRALSAWIDLRKQAAGKKRGDG